MKKGIRILLQRPETKQSCAVPFSKTLVKQWHRIVIATSHLSIPGSKTRACFHVWCVESQSLSLIPLQLPSELRTRSWGLRRRGGGSYVLPCGLSESQGSIELMAAPSDIPQKRHKRLPTSKCNIKLLDITAPVAAVQMKSASRTAVAACIVSQSSRSRRLGTYPSPWLPQFKWGWCASVRCTCQPKH